MSFFLRAGFENCLEKYSFPLRPLLPILCVMFHLHSFASFCTIADNRKIYALCHYYDVHFAGVSTRPNSPNQWQFVLVN